MQHIDIWNVVLWLFPLVPLVLTVMLWNTYKQMARKAPPEIDAELWRNWVSYERSQLDEIEELDECARTNAGIALTSGVLCTLLGFGFNALKGVEIAPNTIFVLIIPSLVAVTVSIFIQFWFVLRGARIERVKVRLRLIELRKRLTGLFGLQEDSLLKAKLESQTEQMLKVFGETLQTATAEFPQAAKNMQGSMYAFAQIADKFADSANLSQQVSNIVQENAIEVRAGHAELHRLIEKTHLDNLEISRANTFIAGQIEQATLQLTNSYQLFANFPNEIVSAISASSDVLGRAFGNEAREHLNELLNLMQALPQHWKNKITEAICEANELGSKASEASTAKVLAGLAEIVETNKTLLSAAQGATSAAIHSAQTVGMLNTLAATIGNIQSTFKDDVTKPIAKLPALWQEQFGALSKLSLESIQTQMRALNTQVIASSNVALGTAQALEKIVTTMDTARTNWESTNNALSTHTNAAITSLAQIIEALEPVAQQAMIEPLLKVLERHEKEQGGESKIIAEMRLLRDILSKLMDKCE